MRTCAFHLVMFTLGALPLLGQGTWSYDFAAQGIDSNYWSTVNASGTFTFTPGSGGVTVAGGNGSFQTGKLNLNLAQFAPITDFSMTVTFTGGQLSGGVHQIQLETYWPGKAVLLDRSNQASVGNAGGNSVNAYDGASVLGFTTLSGADANAGVSVPMALTLTRSGSMFTGYWNGNQFWSGSYQAEPLSMVSLALNNNYGATDATAVTWQTFTLTSSAIPEPSAYAVLAGLAGLGWAMRRRFAGR